ncbi:Hypothetical predicted protein [Mytilus galloprovincialis]|uniref:Uncharacterized protein n=1 Tax=Mytilus galloprovincialis TaxID=29158 RepID=A0A8B6DP73_MYTGA|nr:Hypothetical predicted protein [Mytilus galloprovincialis]
MATRVSSTINLNDVQHFYDENVQLDKTKAWSNSELAKVVVKDILEYVHGADKRFLENKECVGSFHSYTKVSEANEFDFSVVFETGTKNEWKHLHKKAFYDLDCKMKKVIRSEKSLQRMTLKYPVYVGLNEGQDCVTEGPFIVPIKMKRHFRTLVCAAVDNINKTRTSSNQKVIVQNLDDSPALRLTIRQLEGDDINIDMAPLLKLQLPFQSENRWQPDFGWPIPGAKWPSSEKVQQMFKIGINLVTTDLLYWKLSFATCERELLKDIDRNKSCRRRSLRIMKRLCELNWCPKEVTNGLTSYHLINILLFECESYPEDNDWRMSLIGKRILSMLERLLTSIYDKNLPQYLDRRRNLFVKKSHQSLDQAGICIKQFINNPGFYLLKKYK